MPPLLTILASIPTVDGDFLPDAPSKLIQHSRFTKGIRYLTGWDRDESSMFTPTSLTDANGISTFLSARFPSLKPNTIKTLLSLYPLSSFQSNILPNSTITAAYYSASEILRDLTVSCPSLLQSWSFNSASSPAFLYELAQSPYTATFATAGRSYLGISHFSDVPYVFNELESTYYISDPAENALAARMSGTWASFAAFGVPDGNPNSTALTLGSWPAAFGASDKSKKPKIALRVIGGAEDRMQILEPKRTGQVSLLERCEFINSIWDELLT
jgi:carboxylesterase type B